MKSIWILVKIVCGTMAFILVLFGIAWLVLYATGNDQPQSAAQVVEDQPVAGADSDVGDPAVDESTVTTTVVVITPARQASDKDAPGDVDCPQYQTTRLEVDPDRIFIHVNSFNKDQSGRYEHLYLKVEVDGVFVADYYTDPHIGEDSVVINNGGQIVELSVGWYNEDTDESHVVPSCDQVTVDMSPPHPDIANEETYSRIGDDQVCPHAEWVESLGKYLLHGSVRGDQYHYSNLEGFSGWMVDILTTTGEEVSNVECTGVPLDWGESFG